jgi:membrane-bound metal-dependent hydrolase YbcI (DUF457 family)
VDIVTHGLASLAVARGFFPRAGKAAIISAVFVGCAADIDWFTQYLGPSTFLAWHGTYTHSILAIFFFLAAIPSFPVLRNYLRAGRGFVGSPLRAGTLWTGTFGASVCTGMLHIAMDACQSSGVALFWPFSSRRFAADWLPRIDPWILTILIVAIALPELFHLVGSEIGAKAKKPRGQTGAIIGLALVLLYVGARATLHSNVIAMMESRTFHGETPRRASAFPESLSPLTWHGVVETETALNRLDIDAASPNNFDPDASLRLFKPEASPALDAARNTGSARRFLATAQVPKASLEKTETGYVVVLRDLRYAASGESQREIAAVIELDASNKVTSQEIVWARDLHR